MLSRLGQAENGLATYRLKSEAECHASQPGWRLELPVESPPSIKVNHLAKWSSGNTVALNGSHRDDLCGPDSQDILHVDQAWVAQVVEYPLAADLGSSLEPHRLTELDAVAGQKLWEDTPRSSEHCPPGVDHLKLAVLGKSF
ncbi:hypothetical protein RJ640_003369 [Escallonia rubra]|uniref:Uncharacterized protein n=1 Tax=Escallonia rubra TaxID=112253 RepID=A0AA88QI66_9ASTE|nr:hypothetical protein RJ640_003369 [Escallonia rubra]